VIHNVYKLFVVTIFVAVVCVLDQRAVLAQGPCGGKPCPVIKVVQPPPPPGPRLPGPRNPGPKNPGPKLPGPKPTPKPSEPTPPNTVCEDSDLVVVCGMPGCKIVLEGKQSARGPFKTLSTVVTDDLGGYTFQVLGEHFYRAKVSKDGYNSFESDVRNVTCDDQQEIKASLLAKPVMLRVRTDPPEADIYLEGQKQPYGKSDASGLFSYLQKQQTLLIEARKPGYLAATRNVYLAPEIGAREILLSLEPIKAVLRITSNIETARATVDTEAASKSVTEKILLAPGKHTVSVKALGYAPVEFEVTVRPEETVTKDLKLERLPIVTLLDQAGLFYSRHAYDDVVKLAQFILEADAANAAANRLLGFVYLERADLATAQSRFDLALAGGESVALRVRRHEGEKFELSKGHNTCDAQLILGKNELEFKSARSPLDNFKVPYSQVQITGIQLKNNVASYLKTKVTVNGKGRDYNFYSFDRELSQAGKPYLEMIQRLMRAH
jgi:hypothetical protein